MKKRNSISSYNKPKPCYQSGLSLIELMVSMVLGLFLLGGVITNFISTKDTDRMRTAISEMDANARTAFSIMRQTILHAGYPSVNNVRIDKPFFSKRDLPLANPTCGDGVTTRDVSPPGDRQITEDRYRGDVITVVALADNPCKAGMASCPNEADRNPEALVYYDCLGGGILRDVRSVSCSTDQKVGMKDPTQAKIYSTFRLGRRRADRRTLYCDGSRGGTQPLVDNIEFMQILYGIRQDDDTTAFIRAKDVETKDLWGQVMSVQIALLVRSSEKNLLKKAGKNSYTLLDRAVYIRSADRKRLFRIYTTTINLANQSKGALL